jgi:hypothetical protein
LISGSLQRPLAVAASLAVTLSCASATPAGEKVRITQNPEATKGCTFIKTISVVNTWGPGDSQRKLQEEAAKIGANLVFLGLNPYTAGGHSFVHYGGEAYRCSEPPKP